jgi:hypothetical protein
MTLGFAQTFHLPQQYNLDALYLQTERACPSITLTCLYAQLQDVTTKYGPGAAIELFTRLQTRGNVSGLVDGHHVAHHIGHFTAEAFGPSAEALALCPPTYNYGCMHGFFQHALGMDDITDKTAAKMCDNLAQSQALSWKAKVSCYHGFGHGVMENADYNLPRALDVCYKLKAAAAAVESCWQGVFMENVDAALDGKWQQGGFSLTDPLAPCDQLKPIYRYQCFINHAGWLMRFYHDDVAAAARTCLKAPGDSTGPCLGSLGLLTTNKSWQRRLMRSQAQQGSLLDNAWTLCQQFPEGHVSDCVIAALDNLLNTNTVDPGPAHAFCDLVASEYRTACTDRIAADLRYLTPPEPKRSNGPSDKAAAQGADATTPR